MLLQVPPKCNLFSKFDIHDNIYKDRNQTQKAWTEVCMCLQEDFEALGDVKKSSL